MRQGSFSGTTTPVLVAASQHLMMLIGVDQVMLYVRGSRGEAFPTCEFVVYKLSGYHQPPFGGPFGGCFP